MKTIIIAVMGVALLACSVQAQSYYDSPSSYQSYQDHQQSNYEPQQTQQQHQIDPRAFEIKTLPPVLPLNPRGNSGVVIDPNGQAYYWFGNGR
ncbi:MAG: hypothetical protein ACYDHZ_00375 [Dehalococcoidia bacterium]